MPSAGQLMRARKRFATLLPDRATIQRPVDTSDGGGGTTQTWPTLAADVHCRLSPVAGGEDSPGGGDRVSDEATSVVTFEAGQEIATADRIIIEGVTHAVLLVRRRGAWELTRRVETKELKGV